MNFNMDKINTITVIGIGSLGGFVAHSISELKNLKKLILIDFDIVEGKNLINSIYRKCDVGRYKTSSLHDIIKGQNGNYIEIEIITGKYREGETKIPESDLIIDCRDYVCDRRCDIDIRLFMSSRYLIIDCRKQISYNESYEGKYLSQLTKNDLRRSSLIITSFIQDGFIKYMMDNQIIKEVDIDYLNKVSADVKNKNEDKNIIMNYGNTQNRLLNLEENIGTIIQENKQKDIMVTLGDRRISPLSKIIPKNSFQRPNDVLSTMSQMTNSSHADKYIYILSMTTENNICHVELIPEVGAA